MRAEYQTGDDSPLPRMSLADMERVAVAIADSRDRPLHLLINPDGTKVEDGFALSINEAVRSRRPFMIHARPDVVVLDHDDPTRPGLLDEFADEFLGEHRPVICASGQPGRQHLFVFDPDPHNRNWIMREAAEFGVGDCQLGRWIRPPGSPHLPDRRSVLTNCTPDEAVEWLEAPHVQCSLGHRASRALYFGEPSPTGRDQTRSSVVMTATLGMVNAGYTHDEMWQSLMRHLGGLSLREDPQGNKLDESLSRRRWEKHTLATAMTRIQASPLIADQNDALTTIRGARAWWRVHNWKGISGANDRAVLGAILDVAENETRVFGIGLSNRQAAEKAGIGTRTTARNSLNRLKAVGIINRIPREQAHVSDSYSGPAAHRYAIKVPTFANDEERRAWNEGVQNLKRSPVNQSDPGGCEYPTGSVASVSTLNHDAFRRGALGKSKQKLVDRLSNTEPRTAKELATLLGYTTPATVRKHLNELAEHGLANKVGKGWIAISADLDQIAVKLGTAGKGEAQRIKYVAEREANIRKLAERHSKASAFVARMIDDSEGGSVGQREIRAMYVGKWCPQRPSEPVRDHVLIEEIQHQFPKAVFVEHTGSMPAGDGMPPLPFETSWGTWFGIRLKSWNGSLPKPIETIKLGQMPI